MMIEDPKLVMDPIDDRHDNNNGIDDNERLNKQHRRTFRAAASASIAWIESLRVPSSVLLRWGRSTATTSTAASSSTSSNNTHSNPRGDVPLITGLDRVFFGTQPACEAVLVCGIHPPRYLCYMLSGFICDLIQFVIDIILHKVFLLEDASVCWALGFGLSVSFRHTSHRYLVFGDYVGGYWKSLSRMYAGYSIIIVISTLFNIMMTRYLLLPHYVAWVVTLLWTGIVNYFILKMLWSFGGKAKTDDESSGNELKQDIELASPLMSRDERTDGKLQARKTESKR